MSRLLLVVVICGLMRDASAFQILTPASNPCHELILLGALGTAGPTWDAPESGEMIEARATLRARAILAGVPTGGPTQAFVDDVVALYGVRGGDYLDRWILASFVAGVRQPDTRGLAVVRFNNSRETHLSDEGQAAHSLRRSTDNYAEGNVDASAEIRALLTARFEASVERWAGLDQTLRREATWTLPHYGEFAVQVFGPAFDLGEITHTLQDAYAHVLRDEEFRVLSFGNFVEAISGDLHEPRDGLAHSDRMDQCDWSDPFDAARVEAARRVSARWIVQSVAAFRAQDGSDMADLLDEVYALRDGCTHDNDYCGTPWLGPARTDPTEPIHLFFCSATGAPAPASSGAWWVVAALLCFVAVLRRRVPSTHPNRTREET